MTDRYWFSMSRAMSTRSSKPRCQGDCLTNEGRQLQHAVISELNVPNATAAAGGSLRVLIDELEDGAGVRQSCSHDRCGPSAFEFQDPSLEVIETIELAQESRPDVAWS